MNCILRSTMNYKVGQEIWNIETGSGRDLIYCMHKSTCDNKRLIYREHEAGLVNICMKIVCNKEWTAGQSAWRKHVYDLGEEWAIEC